MIIKVSKDTNLKGLVKSISKALESDDQVEVRAMGAESVNIAVKGVAIVYENMNSIVNNPKGMYCVPRYLRMYEDGKTCSIISLECHSVDVH